jgi:E3 ubiquitin-protein ligase RNF13
MGVNSLILCYLLLLSTIQITLSDVSVYNESNQVFEDFEDQEGSFSPSLPSEGLKGYITTTDPLHACEPISPPPNIPTSGYQWIALIARLKINETCPFTTKINNAYNANFSAVIIYNYEDVLFTMVPYGINVHIPATLITNSDGLKLIQNYLYDKVSVNSTPIYHVKITPDQFKYSIYLIPFTAILGILVCGFLGFLLVKWHLQRRRARRHRLPRSALKQLPTKKYVKSDPWEVCAICLDDYEDGAKLRILPCEHAYHMKCIDPWLLNNRRQCPVCKRYVFPNDDNSDEEENTGNQQARTPTEQTPLMNSNDNNPTIETTRNRQLPGRQLLNPLGSGVQNVSFASNESSDDEKNLSSSSGPVTTAELIFERPSSNSRRYGSMNSSSITSNAANFSVESLGGRTDNTNTSRRSVVQDVSDIETTDDENDNGERMQSVIIGSEENRAFANDEQSKDDNQMRV